jgi:capsule polysaccharide export protein KpsE/RkpR
MTTKVHVVKPENSIQDDVAIERIRDERRKEEIEDREARAKTVAKLRLLWHQRIFLFRVALTGFAISLAIAFCIPKRFTSTTRLMPPDDQSSSGLAMVAATLASGGSGGLASVASNVLGLKSTTDIFVGILGSRTVKDRLIERFNLKKVYWDRRIEDARDDLESRTNIAVDRKSQIITIKVTDRSPQRAAAMAQAYVDELDHLVSQLSTSSARRERIFLENRLEGVNRDLETAEKQFGQFASKNTALDIKEQSKAMFDAAAELQGQLIATESEIEGLKQIYTDQNVRVRSLAARATELREQIDKLGGWQDTRASTGPADRSTWTYPSIRDLPLLGVRYADLSRNTKVQEAIFETLTKEFETAKVQEAKEIPTVKVLDPAELPENKSFPPRLLIAALGAVLVVVSAAAFVILSEKWNSVESDDPGKLLAHEIWQGMALPSHRNGDGQSDLLDRVAAKLGWQSD